MFERYEQFLRKEIETFPKIYPAYEYKGEGGINPAYLDLEHAYPLCLNEKRIWAFRTDMVVATGIKNAYEGLDGYTSLKSKIDSKSHKFVNWENRSGHPTLALPEDKYDGSVFYAGFLCQRSEHIQVLLQSGRFGKHTLSKKQQKKIETYLALKFMSAYGVSKVEFIDYKDPDDFYHYISDQDFPSSSTRTYTTTSIALEAAQHFPDHEAKKEVSSRDKEESVKDTTVRSATAIEFKKMDKKPLNEVSLSQLISMIDLYTKNKNRDCFAYFRWRFFSSRESFATATNMKNAKNNFERFNIAQKFISDSKHSNKAFAIAIRTVLAR